MSGEGTVRTRLREGIGIVVLAHPPANRLDPGPIAALGAAIARLGADPAARAVLILGDGPQFSVDPEIADPAPPELSALLAELDRMAVPVVAALAGPASGAGAALALAAHFRLAAPGATLALPGIGAGLLPPGGTIQRLSRIAGAGAALDLALGGRGIDAAAARDRHLVDGIVEGDLPSGGFAFARALVARGQGPRPAPSRAPTPEAAAAAMAAIRAARAGLGESRLVAPARIVDCVEAAFLLPWEAALEFEAVAAADALADPAGRALRHVMRAERHLDPALLARAEDGRSTLSERGLAIAGAFRAAWIMAGRALVRAGHAPEAVDGAARGWGFAAGPLGTSAATGPAPLARRLHAALLAEAARQIDAGHVRGPGEADVLAILGAGFPRWRGGPVFAAGEAGLARMVQEMRGWTAEDPVWEVPQTLARAALAGRSWS